MSTREAFGRALAEFGDDPKVYVVDADLACCTITKYFQADYPDRFFNIGIAEGNMVGIAAGIATTGKTVFACSFAMFSAGRAWERVRNSVAYPRLNVRIVGSHGGISVGEDGPTHQAIEDLAIMRAIPNMLVLNPADSVETREMVKALLEYDGPAYLRLIRSPSDVVTGEKVGEFDLHKGVELAGGSDVTIFATGLMVKESLDAREILQEKGISAGVVNIHTLKPIDEEIILKASNKTGLIVTVEDHNVVGGLGSAVAEVLSRYNPTRLLTLGVQDQFACSGKANDLLKAHGLTGEGIAKAIQDALS
ncbi:MAG: transketolase family protein [Anaerolineaceae bacterium]|nr:transketolase family protein [Anaerolineaceae bacterium]